MTKYNADQKTVKKQKLVQSVSTQTFDNVTGEHTHGEKTSIFLGQDKEPPFVKMYLEDIEILHRLPKKSGDFLFELLMNMNYESEITINRIMKRRICEKLGLENERTINNFLSTMVKKDVLYRVDRGVYIVNPYLLAKGDWNNIKGLRVAYKNNKRIITPDEGQDD